MTAHQFKVGDRVEVVEACDGILKPGVGTITHIYKGALRVEMDDKTAMAQGWQKLGAIEAGWNVPRSIVRPLSPPAPDILTATALELAEACAERFHNPSDADETQWQTDVMRRLARALRAYREARRPDPRVRLRALIEAHGGDDREALLAVLEAAP